jgi:hypothetical protein
VKSEISWRNERWHRGEIGNIVAQQKDDIAVKPEISSCWLRIGIVLGRKLFTPILKAKKQSICKEK